MFTVTLTIQDLDFSTPQAAAFAFRDAIGCAPGPLWVTAIDLDSGEHRVELPPYDRASDTVDALVQAESFMSGFEDDPGQEGIGDMLAGLRAAIQRERARPDMLAALHAVMRCARGELERPVTQRQPWADAQRLVEAAIASEEGGANG